MSPPVTYNDFINQNGATISGGGVWTVESTSTEVMCLSVQPFNCVDVTYCISCLTLEWAKQTSYTVKFKANVSVPMADYKNADTLYYSWSYMIAWADDDVPRGHNLSANSYVGESSYVDTFVSDNMTEMLTTRQTWLGDPFVHSGSTPVAKYGDPTVGYIPITIEVTYPRLPDTSVDYMMKAATFKITGTTPPATINSVTSPATGIPSDIPTSITSISERFNSTSTVASGSAGSSSSTTVISPTFWTVSVASDGQIYSYSVDGGISVGASPPTDSARRKTSPAVIGGAIGGACALLILFISVWICFRRKRRKQEVLAVLATPVAVSLVSPWARRLSRSGTFSPSDISHDNLNDLDGKHVATSLGHEEQTIGDQPPVNSGEAERQTSPIDTSALRAEMPPPAYSSILSPVGGSGDSRNRAPRVPQLILRRTSGGTISEDSGLSLWAQENRAYISEKLEAKLELAGYLPTDDPDAISEDEWERKWNVSNLELAKIRILYAKSHGDV